MKKQSLHFLILTIVIALVSINIHAQTNEIKSKSNSLPKGVTSEWLKNLRDEKGNKIITQDSGDAFQLRNFTGFNPGDQYGVSVASAGDVNGDGYNDIIIGAPYTESGGTDAGRAYIYFGGLNVNTIPDVILSGNEPNDYFGISVSSAGDINGDGYSDVIVGEYGYNGNTGAAIVFLGGVHMDNIADVFIHGENTSDLFGNCVASAGDVNGDGYSDYIVGAFNFNSGKGRAYLYYGGLSLDAAPHVIMTGETAGDQFGVSVSGGDINNDGFSDVIVGANLYNSFKGRAYVFYGGASMNNIADVIFTGQHVNDNFGNSVAIVGDVNGDSFNDVMIGANGYNSSAGIAYLYFGGSNMDNIADLTFDAEISSSGFFGNSVSGAGDMNGDGYPDIMVGAPYFNSGTGKIYIYYGGPNMDNASDLSFSGEAPNSYFGTSVAYVGDMNGDGFADIMAGASGYNSFTGKAYLYMNGMNGTFFPSSANSGEGTFNYFGCSVSCAGDVNGDGFSDVIVGANGYNSLNGRAYIFYGRPNMGIFADVVLTEPGSFDFGSSVSTAGDVNADGYADVIVGAYGYNSNTGRAYIYYGGPSMNNVADVILTGESSGSLFGYSVSCAGDVNGDGYSDVIVGANAYSTNTGKAYIFYGGSAMNNTVDVTLSGQHFTDNFGYSVAGAGDVNGDGYSDVIVGAYGYNGNRGIAYIFFGGQAMNNSSDVTLNGENANDFFGVSVSTAGDVNGDGYSDVIVGAYGVSLNTGRAYIFYGGPSVDNTADVIMSGETSGDLFGISVSSAGDMNEDGYSDAIVGAYGFSANTGRAYIFYGALSMNNSADINITGEGASNSFGISVSSAGDVNGDGHPDIIVGASGNNSGTGRSYIYTTPSPSVKPNLVSVKDVPNDQGGYVKLKWVKSAFDVPVSGTITNYVIEKSFPPGATGYQWEQIGTVVPTQNNAYYYFTAPTPVDSGVSGNSTLFFRVTAYTGVATQLYRSNILSGRSRDNLPPNAVTGFSETPVASNIRLSWNRNHEPDLLNYILYRSTSSTINPDTEPVFATTTDSTYLDTAPLTGLYYYFIVAQDNHYNKSPVVSTESQNITVNMTAFIEGFFNPAGNTQVSDTVKVYLRNAASPFAIVDSSKAVLNTNGSAVLKFGSAPTGSYYLVLKHRNSIETWSKSGGEALTRGSSSSYNFTTAITQAFGSNLKLKGTKYCIYSGDVNHDGFVNLNDIILTYNDGANFVTGYANSDVNGDNITNLTDLIIVYNNSAGFVGKITP